MPEASKKGKPSFEAIYIPRVEKLVFEIAKKDDLKLIKKEIPDEIIIRGKTVKTVKTEQLLDPLSEINKERYKIKELIFEFKENALLSLTIKTKFALPREEIARFYDLNLEYGYIKGFDIPKKGKEKNSYESITLVPSYPHNF